MIKIDTTDLCLFETKVLRLVQYTKFQELTRSQLWDQSYSFLANICSSNSSYPPGFFPRIISCNCASLIACDSRTWLCRKFISAGWRGVPFIFENCRLHSNMFSALLQHSNYRASSFLENINTWLPEAAKSSMIFESQCDVCLFRSLEKGLYVEAI